MHVIPFSHPSYESTFFLMLSFRMVAIDTICNFCDKHQIRHDAKGTSKMSRGVEGGGGGQE